MLSKVISAKIGVKTYVGLIIVKNEKKTNAVLYNIVKRLSWVTYDFDAVIIPLHVQRKTSQI